MQSTYALSKITPSESPNVSHQMDTASLKHLTRCAQCAEPANNLNHVTNN